MENIVLSKPKMTFNVECPRCNSKFIVGESKINVHCKKCRASFETKTNQSVFSMFVPLISQKLKHNNEVIITANEEYLRDLLVIQDLFKSYKNWEVSEITQINDFSRKLFCGQCKEKRKCEIYKKHQDLTTCPHYDEKKGLKTYKVNRLVIKRIKAFQVTSFPY